MKRFRKEKDGTITTFLPPSPGGPYRVEIDVASDTELRALNSAGKLVSVRMSGKPSGRRRQYNLVPVSRIEDFIW